MTGPSAKTATDDGLLAGRRIGASRSYLDISLRQPADIEQGSLFKHLRTLAIAIAQEQPKLAKHFNPRLLWLFKSCWAKVDLQKPKSNYS
ncbi:hypothetical protein VUR80DRAFT_1239 [Thermomyces stellatus]